MEQLEQTEPPDIYEPPVVEEVGAFAELTRGGQIGTFFEGGYAPWYWHVPPVG